MNLLLPFSILTWEVSLKHSCLFTTLHHITSYPSPWNRPWRPRQGLEVELYTFFNLSTRWGQVVNTMPRQLYPRNWPITVCIEVWVGPVASLDRCGKLPHWELIPGPSSPQRVAIPTMLSWSTHITSHNTIILKKHSLLWEPHISDTQKTDNAVNICNITK